VDPDSIPSLILFAALLVLYALVSLTRAAFGSRRVKALCGSENGGHAFVLLLKEWQVLMLASLFWRTALQGTIFLLAAMFAVAHEADMPTVIAFTLSIYLLLVLPLCELLPRAVARRDPERTARFLTAFAIFVWALGCPFAQLLRAFELLFLRLLRAQAEDNHSSVTEAEFLHIVNASSGEEGALNDEEREMIGNIVAFGDARAKDVMTPRMDIVALPFDTNITEAMEVFREEQFSRIPIYKEDLDHIIGILHFKDLVFANQTSGFTIESIMREAFFSYEFKLTSELFAEMRSMNSPLAVILDEYGGTAGIVTLEDMVEEIVGDILDEYDEEKDVTEVIPGIEYITEGAVRIDAFNEAAGTTLVSEDYETIGGYVIGLLGNIPSQDDIVADTENGVTFTVTALDKNRIETLHVRIEKNDAEGIDKQE